MSRHSGNPAKPLIVELVTRRVFGIAILATTALLASVLVPINSAQAADATLGITKSASVSTVQPGDAVAYDIQLTCSSLTFGCVGATITDVLPAELEVTALPSSNSERNVNYDQNTRTLTVEFLLPLTNPSGTFGLPAGLGRTVQVGMRLPTETPVVDGATISNTADGSGSNTNLPTAAASITADIPVVVRPVATKSWSPSSGIALSDAESTVTLGVRNASSSSAQVRKLRVTDDTLATFNSFDVTRLGPVRSYPAGANRVVIGVCTKALPIPCGASDWIESAALSGNGPFSAPAGVALDAITGVRYTFQDSGAGNLPYSASDGQVELGLKLRDTYRVSGLPIDPQTVTTVTNKALPTAIDPADAATNGNLVTAPYNIEPNAITVLATKNMFADSAGNWTTNGNLVAGQDSGITMTLNAKNTSASPVTTLVIDEPSVTTPSDFAKIDASKARFSWPTGATTATFEVTCRSGASPAPQTFNNPPSTQVTIDPLGCGAGIAPASIRLTYSGVDGSGDGTIVPGTAGQLDVHGTLNDSATAGSMTNCFEASAASPQSSSSASVACKPVTVQTPTPGTPVTTKSSGGVTTIVPGQPMTFNMSFRNTGNVPLADAYIVDPPDPTASPNPFDVVQLVKVSVPGSPGSVIEMYVPGPGWVPYSSTSPELSLAKGLKVSLAPGQTLGVGKTFNVSYVVQVREGVPTDGTVTFTNCAATGIAPADPGEEVCSPEVTVVPASAGATLQKSISPGQLMRPEPGLAPQITQVKHSIFNSGTSYLRSMTVTDQDTAFFNLVNYSGGIAVNMPPGANRVKIDACTSACGTFPSGWTQGTATASATPSIPTGVDPDQVQGIRVTFSNSGGGFTLKPGQYLPNSGACKLASVCFNVTAREYQRSSSSDRIPLGTIDDHSDGEVVTNLPTPGTIALGEVTAPLVFVDGSPEIKLTKGPNSQIGPNDTAPFDLTLENTGTTAIATPTIVDKLPDNLAFEENPPGGTPGKPWIVSYPALPTGVTGPAKDDITYTFTDGSNPSDIFQGATMRWRFGTFNLPPGGKINIRVYVKLAGTYTVGTPITNTAGAHADNTSFECAAGNAGPPVTDTPPYDPGKYCLSAANITPLSGNAVDARKWSAGNPLLGFYNTTSGQIVGTDDPSCPQFTDITESPSVVYTRFPCAAIVNPGESMKNIIRIVNTGSTGVTRVVAVDGLPVLGDTGVLLTGDQRGTQWSERPTMLTEVTPEGSATGITTDYTANQFPGADFCTANLDPAPSDTCPTSSFNAGFSDNVTGFRTTIDRSGSPLAQGESVTLKWTMQTPLTLDSQISMPAAWNSFAQKPTFEGGTEGQATEPLKTGVVMRFGNLSVSKQVDGLPAGVDAPGPFTVGYRCTIDGTEIDSGEVTITDDGTVELPMQPTGADCAVWEIDSQGASSSADGEENAIHETVTAGLTDPDGITFPIVNSYQQGKLLISKRVTGEAAGLPLVPSGTVGDGPFQVEVYCIFPYPDGGAQLPDFPASFEIASGEVTELSVDTGYSIPAGAQCTVYEAGGQGATSTVMIADDSDPVDGDAIDVQVKPGFEGGSTVKIENNYAAGSIILQKTLSGPGASVAKGPFTFQFDCTYNSQTLAPIMQQVTVAAPTVKVTPLPLGATCDVTETDAGDSTSAVPTVIATDVLVRADEDSPLTVTADNTYPTVPECPLNVGAKSAKAKVKRSGKTTVVSSAGTSDDCRITSSGKNKTIKVRCSTSAGTRGDLAYCTYSVSRKGKVVVRTYGYRGIYVTVTVTAVPKKGSQVTDSTTWKRKWRVR